MLNYHFKSRAHFLTQSRVCENTAVNPRRVRRSAIPDRFRAPQAARRDFLVDYVVGILLLIFTAIALGM